MKSSHNLDSINISDLQNITIDSNFNSNKIKLKSEKLSDSDLIELIADEKKLENDTISLKS